MTDPNAPRPDDGPPSGPPPSGPPSGYGQQYPPPPSQPAYGQPAYGQPPSQYPPPGPPAAGPPAYSPMPPNNDMASAGKGFFAALFDFSFAVFVTPKIIRVLYLLITIFLGIGVLVLVIAGFNDSAGSGIAALIFGVIGYFIYLAFARVILEFYMAVFRIADDVQIMRRRG